MTEHKKRSPYLATAFWDTSAIVPLCCFQGASNRARQIARIYGRQIVWWVTSVEAISALQRLVRERHISSQESAHFLARLSYLRTRWNEIQPTDALRGRAEQLLRMHKLRAADALQLAAALAWCNNNPQKRTFIVNDDALADAAQIEGFAIVRLQ